MHFSLPALFALTTFYASIANGRKQSKENWNSLKLPFNIIPDLGFYDQPRTRAEAELAGWTKVDDSVDCKDVNNRSVWGYRYAPPGEFTEMLLIYDINGFIAGMQSVVPKNDTLDDKYYKFSSSPYYNLDIVNGIEVYLTTAYFVNPNIICNRGLTQRDLDTEGTGNVLLFQTGPTPRDLYVAPLTAAAANRTTEWYEDNCFPNMGDHWNRFDYDLNQSCDEMFPVQLVYDHQGDHPLRAFVWSHQAALNGDRWEKMTKQKLDYVGRSTPYCVYNHTENPGISTQHVYLKDYVETCDWPLEHLKQLIPTQYD